jgi:hypothetical protein
MRQRGVGVVEFTAGEQVGGEHVSLWQPCCFA